jgi:hypothetical protein
MNKQPKPPIWEVFERPDGITYGARHVATQTELKRVFYFRKNALTEKYHAQLLMGIYLTGYVEGLTSSTPRPV